jgi:(E)-4-hydroxy-3-methylbut-2-enyl-diphosphate synthase
MDYNKIRRQSREVKIGNIAIGRKNRIALQSMTNTDTHDIDACYGQISQLISEGCDIVRLTAPDKESAKTFYALKERGIKIPLVADVHFDYKIAIECIYAGADKIRINPGNIGSRDKVKAVVSAARERKVPIRIGVNSGSLEKSILAKYERPTAEALCESALSHARILEELDFYDTVISVKASSVYEMIEANRMLADKTDYPLHLGVTEAGARLSAAIKSSVGIGALLSEGIGDTVRVSLTDKPAEEIKMAKNILSSLGLYENAHMNIIACPTCGRTKISLIKLLSEFEKRAELTGISRLPITVALMGCVVNGPGEAREADIGVAGGVGEALLFKKGVPVRKIREESLIDELISEIKKDYQV